MLKHSILYTVFYFGLGLNCASANLCQSYLNQPKASFLEQTKDKLIALQLEVYEQQQALVHDVHLSLKDLSVPYRDSNGQMVKPVTNVSAEALNLIGQWPNLPLDSAWRLNLLENILEDPYLRSLVEGWNDYRSDYLKSMIHLALSHNPQVPTPVNGTYQIQDYFDLHLKFDGPMRLHPYLLVLRIMRDYDPNLNDPTKSVGYLQKTYFSIREKINKILELQKVLYILNRDIQKLSDLRYGSEKIWNQVKTLKDAVTELYYLRRNIVRLYSPQFSRMDYEALIMMRDLSPSVTYEDYLVAHFANHHVVEESDLVMRYRIIKHIVRLVTASQSLEELKEVMASQMGLVNFAF